MLNGLLLAGWLAGTPQDSGAAWDTTVRARLNRVTGDAGEALRYRDLFHTGHGVELELGRTWLEDSLEYGVWGSLAFDRFQGDGYTDDVGDRVKPSPLDRVAAFVGGRLTLRFDEPVFRGDRLFLDLRAGAGAAWQDEVRADLRVGGVPVDASFLESGLVPGFQAGLSTGVSGRAFTFAFGIGVRAFGAPERGGDVSSAIAPDSWVEWSAEAGVSFRW